MTAVLTFLFRFISAAVILSVLLFAALVVLKRIGDKRARKAADARYAAAMQRRWRTEVEDRRREHEIADLEASWKS